jgi:two-component sensor histidine kinase/CheY-like chemotaxis protein
MYLTFMRVVMVDHSAADRKLCRLLLEEAHGRKVEFYEADHASAGLDACRAVAPDCVLLDQKLPDMSGLEFLRCLRGAEMALPLTAVVLLTGVSGEQTAISAMNAGAQDYLIKDRITAEGLRLAIDRATQKLGLARTLAAERDRLAQSLAEKEILLKEVHHRVKNNLQVIASLLRMQAGIAQDSGLAASLRDSLHRVESIALIHEQLYDSQDLREVDIGRNADMLLANLFHSYGVDPGRITGRVTIESVEGRPLILGVDQAIPVGLILNELISNALKHAFPEGRAGAIVVEGRLRRGEVHLAVRDNGAGAPADFQISRTEGSLGLRIVGILARQLKGSVHFERSGLGSVFRICFPERYAEKKADG